LKVVSKAALCCRFHETLGDGAAQLAHGRGNDFFWRVAAMLADSRCWGAGFCDSLPPVPRRSGAVGSLSAERNSSPQSFAAWFFLSRLY